MFHFPVFPPHTLYIQVQVTGHDSSWVSPFGHPRIHARLTAPRGISQPPTSFIGSQCQGIHHAPLNTYNTKPKNESPTHTTHPRKSLQHMRVSEKFALHADHTQPTKVMHAQMLATTIHKSNTTPHHQSRATTDPPTTHSGQGTNGLLSQSPIVCPAVPSPQSKTRSRCGSTFVVHQTLTHYRSEFLTASQKTQCLTAFRGAP